MDSRFLAIGSKLILGLYGYRVIECEFASRKIKAPLPRYLVAAYLLAFSIELLKGPFVKILKLGILIENNPSINMVFQSRLPPLAWRE